MSKKKQLQLKVTDKHIMESFVLVRNGGASLMCSCPIALAIKDLIVDDTPVRVRLSHIRVNTDDGSSDKLYMPQIGREFIEKFDTVVASMHPDRLNTLPSPIDLTLSIPPEIEHIFNL